MLDPKQNVFRQAAFLFTRAFGVGLLAISAFAAAPPSASALKAIFLFHFTQFVEWPPMAFSSAEQPFVIGVFGEDPFSDLLDAAVRGEEVHGHRIVVRRFQDPHLLGTCHLVYVSPGSERAFSAGGVSRKPVLTVGETDEFLQSGGMIEFLTENSRVRLRVDLTASRASSLEISSKLLRVAEVIGHPRS